MPFPKLSCLALLIAGLAACAPQTPQVTPQLVSQVAIEMERQLRKDVGKPVDDDVRLRSVKRTGNHLTLSFTLTDPEAARVARANPGVLDRLTQSIVKSEFCGDRLLKEIVNQGLSLDFIFYSQAGQRLSQGSVDRC